MKLRKLAALLALSMAVTAVAAGCGSKETKTESIPGGGDKRNHHGSHYSG